MYIALNCEALEQYGRYEQQIVFPPFTELVDAQKTADEMQSGQGPPVQQQQGYGSINRGYGPAQPPLTGSGMYGGPPPPVNAGYNGNQYQQQGHPPSGMYGGPPPPANGGMSGGGYGGGVGGGHFSGPPPQQQQAQPQGTYGGPTPQHNSGTNVYVLNNANPAQPGYNPYVPAGGVGAGAGGSRPPPQYQAQGAIARDEAPPRIMPISALNPYTARWAIRGRVTSKGELRRCVSPLPSQRTKWHGSCG